MKYMSVRKLQKELRHAMVAARGFRSRSRRVRQGWRVIFKQSHAQAMGLEDIQCYDSHDCIHMPKDLYEILGLQAGCRASMAVVSFPHFVGS